MKYRIKKVKLIAFDVDGVLTDGKISYDSRGIEIKHFDVHDGFGFTLLNEVGFRTAIITGRVSKAVIKRAKDLKINKVYQNARPKIKAYNDLLRTFKLKPEEICFVGDDLMDVPLLKKVGFAVAVAGACGEAKRVAHYVTKKHGGSGAAREVIELILKKQGKWDKVTWEYK